MAKVVTSHRRQLFLTSSDRTDTDSADLQSCTFEMPKGFPEAGAQQSVRIAVCSVCVPMPPQWNLRKYDDSQQILEMQVHTSLPHQNWTSKGYSSRVLSVPLAAAYFQAIPYTGPDQNTAFYLETEGTLEFRVLQSRAATDPQQYLPWTVYGAMTFQAGSHYWADLRAALSAVYNGTETDKDPTYGYYTKLQSSWLPSVSYVRGSDGNGKLTFTFGNTLPTFVRPTGSFVTLLGFPQASDTIPSQMYYIPNPAGEVVIRDPFLLARYYRATDTIANSVSVYDRRFTLHTAGSVTFAFGTGPSVTAALAPGTYTWRSFVTSLAKLSGTPPVNVSMTVAADESSATLSVTAVGGGAATVQATPSGGFARVFGTPLQSASSFLNVLRFTLPSDCYTPPDYAHTSLTVPLDTTNVMSHSPMFDLIPGSSVKPPPDYQLTPFHQVAFRVLDASQSYVVYQAHSKDAHNSISLVDKRLESFKVWFTDEDGDPMYPSGQWSITLTVDIDPITSNEEANTTLLKNILESLKLQIIQADVLAAQQTRKADEAKRALTEALQLDDDPDPKKQRTE